MCGARRFWLRLAVAIGGPALVMSCTVGPNYVRPTVVAPAVYKEMDGWKTAQPQDTTLRGAWWDIFADAQLQRLEEQVSISNQNVAAAAAQVRVAQALVEAARSSYFPTLSIGVGVTRSRQSANLAAGPTAGRTITDYSLPLEASWEPDLWGRIRRSVESQGAGAQASQADLESTRLSVQTALAQSYFTLRVLDAERQLLDNTVSAYQKSLELTQHRYTGGVVSKVDVVQAETQLKTAQAQAIDVGVQRAQLEHAIAALTGQAASEFSLPPAPLTATPPAIPVGLPSELLERRPDIAAAERRVAAANAQIGVAQAAFYPTVTLGISGGFESGKLANWLSLASRLWSVGPSISQTVFDGGLRRAQTEQARAAYDTTVADYRQTVLSAFQDVEDNVAALRILEDEARVQDEAVKAAEEAVALTNLRYTAGTVSYLDVIVAQTAALTNERTAIDLLGRRMTAAVLLVKAVGGGWSASALRDVSEGGGDASPDRRAAR